MSNHSPTPWHVDVTYLGKDRQRTDFVIRSKADSLPDGSRVAIISDGSHVLDPKPNEAAAANATFIVRAVNSHEELLEALKDALRIVQAYRPQAERTISQSQAAIAKAEGKGVRP